MGQLRFLQKRARLERGGFFKKIYIISCILTIKPVLFLWPVPFTGCLLGNYLGENRPRQADSRFLFLLIRSLRRLLYVPFTHWRSPCLLSLSSLFQPPATGPLRRRIASPLATANWPPPLTRGSTDPTRGASTASRPQPGRRARSG